MIFYHSVSPLLFMIPLFLPLLLLASLSILLFAIQYCLILALMSGLLLQRIVQYLIVHLPPPVSYVASLFLKVRCAIVPPNANSKPTDVQIEKECVV